MCSFKAFHARTYNEQLLSIVWPNEQAASLGLFNNDGITTTFYHINKEVLCSQWTYQKHKRGAHYSGITNIVSTAIPRCFLTTYQIYGFWSVFCLVGWVSGLFGRKITKIIYVKIVFSQSILHHFRKSVYYGNDLCFSRLPKWSNPHCTLLSSYCCWSSRDIHSFYLGYRKYNFLLQRCRRIHR